MYVCIYIVYPYSHDDCKALENCSVSIQAAGNSLQSWNVWIYLWLGLPAIALVPNSLHLAFAGVLGSPLSKSGLPWPLSLCGGLCSGNGPRCVLEWHFFYLLSLFISFYLFLSVFISFSFYILFLGLHTTLPAVSAIATKATSFALHSLAIGAHHPFATRLAVWTGKTETDNSCWAIAL